MKAALNVVLGPWRWWTRQWNWLYEHRLKETLATIALIVVVSAFVTASNTLTIGQANKSALVTNCKNANESRAAARALWGYVLDLSLASNPDMSAAEEVYLAEFRAWVNKVYRPHDCDDLSKAYEIPPPPSIPAPQ